MTRKLQKLRDDIEEDFPMRNLLSALAEETTLPQVTGPAHEFTAEPPSQPEQMGRRIVVSGH